MPQCTNCPRKQAVLNPAGLCKGCFEDRQVEEDVTLDKVDLTKPLNELNLGDIVNVIKEIIKPITAKLDSLESLINNTTKAQNAKYEMLQANLKEKEETIETLSQIIINMQSSLNRIDMGKRITNIIISGLTEEDIYDKDDELVNDTEKVKRLFETMDVDKELIDSTDLIITRIGQQNDSYTRLLKVNVKSKTSRDTILAKAKTLKTKHEPWKKVYVKKDVHMVYAKENQRLHNKRKDLKEKNPDKDVRIVDGKLLVDDQTVDKNMFFR